MSAAPHDLGPKQIAWLDENVRTPQRAVFKEAREQAEAARASSRAEELRLRGPYKVVVTGKGST